MHAANELIFDDLGIRKPSLLGCEEANARALLATFWGNPLASSPLFAASAYDQKVFPTNFLTSTHNLLSLQGTTNPKQAKMSIYVEHHPSSLTMVSNLSTSTHSTVSSAAGESSSFHGGGIRTGTTAARSSSRKVAPSSSRRGCTRTGKKLSTIKVGGEPQLTFFHKTNEMVLRDNQNRVCALIRGGSSSSSTVKPQSSRWYHPSQHRHQEYTIYGVTPMYKGQEKASAYLGQVSDVVRMLREECGDGLALYKWAVIETKSRKVFASRVSLTLQLITSHNDPPSPSTSSSPTKYVAKEFQRRRGGRNSSNNLPGTPRRDRQLGKIVTFTTLRHTMVTKCPTTTTSTSPAFASKNNELSMICPSMEPSLCVFYLACAEEFIEYCV